MNTYRLRLLYAGLAVALVVLIVGVIAAALHLPYAFTIIAAALTAMGGLVRAISLNLTPPRNRGNRNGRVGAR